VIATARNKSGDSEKKKCDTKNRFHRSTSWNFRGNLPRGGARRMLALTTSSWSEADASERFF